jgi:hypothetical protein
MISFAFEPSGRAKQPTIEELATADEQVRIITYTPGTMADGNPCYAYVAVKPSKFQQFRALTAAKTPFILNDYGTVVAAGFGTLPAPEVIEDMRKRFGMDEHFENNILATAKAQQLAFLKKQEENRSRHGLNACRHHG